MCSKDFLNDIAYEIKKPALHLSFNERSQTAPTVDSHLGGMPFMLKRDKWPTCEVCSKDMEFVLQIRELNANEEVSLKTYYCCNCQIDKYKPNMRVIEYKNPIIENVTVNKEYQPKIPYVEIRMEAAWSMPDWKMFKNLFPHLIKKIELDFPGPIDQFREMYGTYRYNNHMVGIEGYSCYGGYAEYVSVPKRTKCSCCKQDAEFVFQLDSLEEYNIDWNQMTLYCYKCQNTGIYSFFLS